MVRVTRLWSTEEIAELGEPTGSDINELQERIEQVIHGQNPLLVGVVLADVVAKYFAGHNQKIREGSMDLWIATMQDLIKVNEAELLDQFPEAFKKAFQTN